MHLTQHDWQEDDWDTRVIGFFTTVFPKAMHQEYATKVVTNEFLKNRHSIKIPTFRLQNIPLSIKEVHTRVYGLEVKSADVREMMAAIKSNISPGSFIQFHMRSINEDAFEKAAKYVASKNVNTWSFMINYVSEGCFFKLKDKVKQALNIDHIIYNPIQKTMKILIAKKLFDQTREKAQNNLQKWSLELDPDNTRQFDTSPEVAYLARDDFLNSSSSYTSHSITSILSFEIDEIEVKKSNATVAAPTTETTPSDLSDPVAPASSTNEICCLKEEVKMYKHKLEKCTTQMTKFQEMLEIIMIQVEKISTPLTKSPNRRLA